MTCKYFPTSPKQLKIVVNIPILLVILTHLTWICSLNPVFINTLTVFAIGQFDKILCTINDCDCAVLVQLTDISSPQPPILHDGLSGNIITLPISCCDRWSTHPHLTLRLWFVCTLVVSVRYINKFDLTTRNWSSNTAVSEVFWCHDTAHTDEDRVEENRYFLVYSWLSLWQVRHVTHPTDSVMPYPPKIGARHTLRNF
jgi:hypothetical protein